MEEYSFSIYIKQFQDLIEQKNAIEEKNEEISIDILCGFIQKLIGETNPDFTKFENYNKLFTENKSEQQKEYNKRMEEFIYNFTLQLFNISLSNEDNNIDKEFYDLYFSLYPKTYSQLGGAQQSPPSSVTQPSNEIETLRKELNNEAEGIRKDLDKIYTSYNFLSKEQKKNIIQQLKEGSDISTRIIAYQTRLKAFNEKLRDALRTTVQGLQAVGTSTTVEEAGKGLKELQATIDANKANMEEMKSRHAEEIKEATAQCEEEKNKLLEQIKQIAEEIGSDNDAENILETIKSQQASIEANKKTIEEEKAKLSAIESKIKEFKQTGSPENLQNLNKQKDAILADLETIKGEMDKMKTMLASSQAAAAEHTKRAATLTELQTKLTGLEKEKEAELDRLKQGHAEAIQALEGKNKELKEKVEELTASLRVESEAKAVAEQQKEEAIAQKTAAEAIAQKTAAEAQAKEGDAKLREELEQQKAELETMTRLKPEVDDLRAQKTHLEEQLAEKNRRIAEIEDQLRQIPKIDIELEPRIQELQEQLNASELKSANRDVLENNLRQAKHKSLLNQDTILGLESKISSSAIEKSRLEESLRKLQEEKAELENEKIKQVEEKSGVDTQVQSLQQEKSRLEEQLKALEQNKSEHNTELRTRLQTALDETQARKLELKSITTNRDSKAAEIQKLGDEKTALESQLKQQLDLQSRLTETQKILSEISANRDRKEGDNQTLREQIQDLKAKTSALSSKDSRIIQLEEQQRILQEKINSTSREAQEKKAELDRIAPNIDEKARQVTDLTLENETLKKSIKQIEREKAKVEAELEAIKKEHSDRRAALLEKISQPKKTQSPVQSSLPSVQTPVQSTTPPVQSMRPPVQQNGETVEKIKKLIHYINQNIGYSKQYLDNPTIGIQGEQCNKYHTIDERNFDYKKNLPMFDKIRPLLEYRYGIGMALGNRGVVLMGPTKSNDSTSLERYDASLKRYNNMTRYFFMYFSKELFYDIDKKLTGKNTIDDDILYLLHDYLKYYLEFYNKCLQDKRNITFIQILRGYTSSDSYSCKDKTITDNLLSLLQSYRNDIFNTIDVNSLNPTENRFFKFCGRKLVEDDRNRIIKDIDSKDIESVEPASTKQHMPHQRDVRGLKEEAQQITKRGLKTANIRAQIERSQGTKSP